jgi:hypothetical protein
MNRIIILCFGLLLSPFWLNAKVEIEVNNNFFQYETPPTLAEALEPVALTSRWYWPVAKLYRLSAPAPEALRIELLQLVEQIKLDAPASVVSQLNALQYQVKQWRLAERVLIPIDCDRARLEVSFNPRFESGQYVLQLVNRPQTVQFWGALKNSLTLNHRGGTAIADYVSALSLSDLADPSLVYVIQPDGRILKSGVASWNRQHIEAMPGAQVFVPFALSWFRADMQRLNSSLLALALHRVE